VATPFDATLKDLVEAYPRDWLAQLGLADAGPASLIDADLSTVSAEADKVIRVEDAMPWLLHLELQASRDPTLPRRVLKYNVLLHDRHELPVHSAVVLLRPEADHRELTGLYQYQPPPAHGPTGCCYEVVRLWQRPVEEVLQAGIGTLPLAPLCRVGPEALPAVVRRMEERLSGEAAPADQGKIWTATYILMGLRYPPEMVAPLLRGVRAMKESSTYQAILAEGIERGIEQGIERGVEQGLSRGARNSLLLVGTERFGPAGPAVRATIEATDNLHRLEELTRRVLHVSNWDELLNDV